MYKYISSQEYFLINQYLWKRKEGNMSGQSKKGSSRKTFVVMESPFWLRWWPESSYVKKWHRTLHIPCTNVNFLGSISSYNYVRYNYLEDLGKGYRGSFYTILATSCESIIISKFKQIKQKGKGKGGQGRKFSCRTGPGTASADPTGSSGAEVALHNCLPWGWDDLANHPNMDHSLNAGMVLPLAEAALCYWSSPWKGLRTEGSWPEAPPASRTIGPSLKGSGQHTIVAPTASSCTNINSASRHRVWPFPVCYPRLCLSSLH